MDGTKLLIRSNFKDSHELKEFDINKQPTLIAIELIKFSKEVREQLQFNI